MAKRETDDEDTDMVPDGGVVRVPLHLCDAMERKAFFDRKNRRYAELADEARKIRTEARDEYVHNLTNAWRPKGQAPQRDPERKQLSLADAQALRNSSYQAYKARIQDAWKTDPRTANAVESQLERERGRNAQYTESWNEEPDDPATAVTTQAAAASNKGGGVVTEADVEARRRKAHAEFSERLSNA
jgi:hypothetical protein